MKYVIGIHIDILPCVAPLIRFTMEAIAHKHEITG